MADLLGIGSSALLAYRKALDTAGHNIANANTPGYTRQRVDLSSRLGGPSGSGYVGSGVQVDTVKRITDALLGARLQGDASGFGRAEAFQALAGQVDQWLSSADAGLSRPLQSFLSSVNAVAANPASTAARQTLLADAATLAARFASEQSRLDSLDETINQQLRQNVTEINGYATQLAQLNARIAQAQGAAGGQPPNDLLDQREQLVLAISSRIGVSTVTQGDGTLSVFVGNGQALVNGGAAGTLTVLDDEFASGRPEIGFGSARIGAHVGGGAIGGLLDARRELIDPARNELGRMAAGLTEAVNAQHRLGMTQSGALGGDFFAPLSGDAYAATANAGTAQVSVAFGAPGALESGDFELRYDGAAWHLFDAAGSERALAGDGSAGNPLRAAGIEMTLSGTAAAGDRFRIQPMRSAAAGMRVAIGGPGEIAAANPVRAGAALANTGTGSIGAISAVDGGNADLLDPVTIQFTGPNTYNIDGAGAYAWTAGGAIEHNGWRLQLNGQPAAGDSFQVTAQAAGSSDSANLRQLAGVLGGRLLDGGRTTLGETQSARVARAGTTASQADLALQAQSAIKVQGEAQRESVSGVNLDEEAADLVRFQQAYQAAARIIQVADETFRALLNAAGN